LNRCTDAADATVLSRSKPLRAHRVNLQQPVDRPHSRRVIRAAGAAVVLFFLAPRRCPDLCPLHAGLPTLSVPRTRRHDDAMAARGWSRLGWAISAIATIALAAYMVSVGWSRANLIAGVGAFFVAVPGLVVALAARQRAQMEQRAIDVKARSFRQEAIDVKARSFRQEAHVSSQDKVVQSMARITARSVYQRLRAFTQVRTQNVEREGDRDGS
jgi:hypothetical protein